MSSLRLAPFDWKKNYATQGGVILLIRYLGPLITQVQLEMETRGVCVDNCEIPTLSLSARSIEFWQVAICENYEPRNWLRFNKLEHLQSHTNRRRRIGLIV